MLMLWFPCGVVGVVYELCHNHVCVGRFVDVLYLCTDVSVSL